MYFLMSNFIDPVHKQVNVEECSVRKGFLKILQNSQGNTCARVFFLTELQTTGVFLRILRSF